MTRKEFMASKVTVIRDENVTEEVMTRAELACEALELNSQERDDLFREWCEKSKEIEKNWEGIKENCKKFRLPVQSKDEFIARCKPSFKQVDNINWYSEKALGLYCDAMNYER